MTQETVKLNDGTTVPLEVFITWHHTKQNYKTLPLDEIKKKIERRANKHKRAVNTPFGQFSSVTEAVKETKIHTSKLLGLLKNIDVPDYSYVNPKPSDFRKITKEPNKRSSKKTVTPLGTYESFDEAAKANKLSLFQLRRLMSKKPEDYYFHTIGPRNKSDVDKIVKIKKARVINHKLTQEERKKVSNLVAKQIMRPVITPYGRFESVGYACKALNVSSPTLLSLIHNTAYPKYKFVNNNHINPTKIHHYSLVNVHKRCVSTPYGNFKSKKIASEILGVSIRDIEKLIKDFPKLYFYTEHLIGKSHGNVVMTPIGIFSSKAEAALAYLLPTEQFDVLLDMNDEDFYYIKKSNV